MLVQDLMNQTEMTFDELAPVFTACKVQVKDEQTEISESVAKRIRSMVEKIGGSQPKLPQLTGTAEQPTAPTTPPDEGKLAELTNNGEPNKLAIRDFAQANQLTQKTVIAGIEAIQQRNIRLTLEAAYLQRQQELQVAQVEQMGRAIADYQHLQQQSQIMSDRVDALRASSYDVDALTTSVLGVSFSRFHASAQTKIDNMNQKNQEDDLIINLLTQGQTPEAICQLLGKQAIVKPWHEQQARMKTDLQKLCS